jgi:hypothetical protein
VNGRALLSFVRWHAARMSLVSLFGVVLLGLVAWSTAAAALRYGAPLACALLALLATCAAIGAATWGDGGTAPRSLLLLSAPLYGRQLARALVVAPSLVAFACALAGWAGALAAGGGRQPLWLVPFLAAPLAATVALSATLREGARALLYRVLALGSGLLLAALPLTCGTLGALAGALALTAILGFVALRAFGEALARYDPVG